MLVARPRTRCAPCWPSRPGALDVARTSLGARAHVAAAALVAELTAALDVEALDRPPPMCSMRLTPSAW